MHKLQIYIYIFSPFDVVMVLDIVLYKLMVDMIERSYMICIYSINSLIVIVDVKHGEYNTYNDT